MAGCNLAELSRTDFSLVREVEIQGRSRGIGGNGTVIWDSDYDNDLIKELAIARIGNSILFGMNF